MQDHYISYHMYVNEEDKRPQLVDVIFCRIPVSATYTCTFKWCGVYRCTAPARTGGWVPLPGVDR